MIFDFSNNDVNVYDEWDVSSAHRWSNPVLDKNLRKNLQEIGIMEDHDYEGGEDADDTARVDDDSVDDSEVAADEDGEDEVKDGGLDRVHVEAGGGSVVKDILRLSSIWNTDDFVDILGVARQSCS